VPDPQRVEGPGPFTHPKNEHLVGDTEPLRSWTEAARSAARPPTP
jgi:hypothetical protein